MTEVAPVVVRVVEVPDGSALAVGTAFAVRGPTAVLGRSPDADLVLPDRTVSRRHARLDVGSGVTVTALTTSNGTFLGGIRLTEEAVAVPAQGGELQLGGVVLEIAVLADTTPVLEPLTQSSSSSGRTARLTVVWDAGQCSARCGRRDLGLTSTPARLLGLLAERPGEVVHYWDLQGALGTAHLAPLATAVRQALLAAIESGALDESAVRAEVHELTGRPTHDLPPARLVRQVLQARRGHGYVLNLIDVELVHL